MRSTRIGWTSAWTRVSCTVAAPFIGAAIAILASAGAVAQTQPAAAPSAATPKPSGATALSPRELGEAIYHGHQPLVGRIRGHDTSLPTQASRCINCHVGTRPPALPSIPSASTQTFGPSLHAEHLTQMVARRGGPPSKYDADTLCILLRRGLDPAMIQLPRTMPLYEASPEQCQALWSYLTSVKGRP
jgi:hypothetical protein